MRIGPAYEYGTRLDLVAIEGELTDLIEVTDGITDIDDLGCSWESLRDPTHKDLRLIKLPKFLKAHLESDNLTQTQYDGILLQLESNDPESWYLAFKLIEQILEL